MNHNLRNSLSQNYTNYKIFWVKWALFNLLWFHPQEIVLSDDDLFSQVKNFLDNVFLRDLSYILWNLDLFLSNYVSLNDKSQINVLFSSTEFENLFNDLSEINNYFQDTRSLNKLLIALWIDKSLSKLNSINLIFMPMNYKDLLALWTQQPNNPSLEIFYNLVIVNTFRNIRILVEKINIIIEYNDSKEIKIYDDIKKIRINQLEILINELKIVSSKIEMLLSKYNLS